MSFIEKLLKKLAIAQNKYKYIIFILTILLTVFFIFGLTKIEIETDFSKMNPQDLDIFVLNDKITDDFGGKDIVVILFRFDKSLDYKSEYNDIRNPEIINYLKNLENEYKKETLVDSVFSASTYLGSFNFDSVEEVKSAIDIMPGVESLFSKDYTTTIMYLTADLSGSQDKTTNLMNMISEKLENIQKPSGIEYMVINLNNNNYDYISKNKISDLSEVWSNIIQSSVSSNQAIYLDTENLFISNLQDTFVGVDENVVLDVKEKLAIVNVNKADGNIDNIYYFKFSNCNDCQPIGRNIFKKENSYLIFGILNNFSKGVTFEVDSTFENSLFEEQYTELSSNLDDIFVDVIYNDNKYTTLNNTSSCLVDNSLVLIDLE